MSSVQPIVAQEGKDGFPPDTVERLQTSLAAYVDAEHPGVIVWIDMPEHRFAGASGYANLAAEIPMSPNDAFRIGSITKMFTSVLVLQLVEEGDLLLDDPIALWLPEIATELPYGDQVTVRQLLGHTSGVPELVANRGFLVDIASAATLDEAGNAHLACNTSSDRAVEILATYVYGQDPFFAPGADGQWLYTNTDYILAGLLIEAVTDQPYHEVLRERILDPLGMENTYLHCLEEPRMQPVHGYLPAGFFVDLGGKDVGERVIVDAYDFHPFDWSAGGLVSTAEDMALFGRALYNGDLFDDPATLDIMLEPVISSEQIEQTLGYETYNSGYAMGVQVGEDGIWHSGGNFGYSTLFYYFPHHDAVLVVFFNSEVPVPGHPLVELSIQVIHGAGN